MWIKMDFKCWPVTTSSVVGPRRSSKALPKAKLVPKKVMVTGDLMLLWPTTAFWILAKPLYLKSMLSNLTHWIVQQNGPKSSPQHLTTCCTANTLKVKRVGCEVLPHLPYSSDLSPTNYQFLMHLNNFLKGKRFHNQQDIENAFQSSLNLEAWVFFFFLKHGFFMLQEQTNLFLVGKNLLFVMVPILINKDVFELSYYDLEFMVQNSDYICTSLIALHRGWSLVGAS